MGKCKHRIFSRSRSFDNMIFMSRNQAVQTATEKLGLNPYSVSARNLITLFGLSAEELSENGVSYEILRSLNALMI